MQENKIRQLPNDINAEAALLSAMIIDDSIVPKAVSTLEETNFFRKSHRIIFRAITELHEENTEIDLITLINKLKQLNKLKSVGGEKFINELSNVVVSSANFDYHAKIVEEKSLLRKLIQTSNSIINNAYNDSEPVENIIDQAEQEIFKIAETPQKKAFIHVKKLMKPTIKDIGEIADSKTSILGVPSGFKDIDKKLGGFRSGQFIVLAARPAMGKSSLALNMAFKAAYEFDKKVAIFTMEMEAEELLMRILSSVSQISMDTMLKGYGMNQDKLSQIFSAAELISEKSLYIDDNGANTILDIRAKSRRLKAEINGLDLIIIDYLQLMNSKSSRDNRQQEIAEISRKLKILAKDLNVPIIALSQLNRALEKRDDRRPRLADLRESGAIEQDADIVMFIYRDEVYFPDNKENEGKAEVIIRKNRHGPIGKVELQFDKEYTTFRDMFNF